MALQSDSSLGNLQQLSNDVNIHEFIHVLYQPVYTGADIGFWQGACLRSLQVQFWIAWKYRVVQMHLPYQTSLECLNCASRLQARLGIEIRI